MNNSISPRVTAWHLADLESKDSGVIESILKDYMDAKARYTPLVPRLLPSTSTTPPPVVGTLSGLPLPSFTPVTASGLLTDYGSNSSTETNPQKNTNPGMDVNNPINLDTPIAQPPISVNVTPTRQEPLQVGFDNAVDLLDICESLLPGHGQFSCHFKYLYFFMNSERCYLNETAYPGINTEIQTFELLFVILLLRKKGILLFS